MRVEGDANEVGAIDGIPRGMSVSPNQVTGRGGQDSRTFMATRWSLIAAAGHRERAPLAELCARYWYPVYAFARRAGHPPEASERIARNFFQHLVDHRIGDLAQSPPQSFRDWLLAELTRFLAQPGPALATPGPAAPEPPRPLDHYEARHRAESGDEAGPEAGFRRSFAIEILDRAHQRLGREATEAGHGRMFALLEAFLTADPQPGQYEAVARELGSGALAVVIAVRRLRQRYRELVDEELADTISDPSRLEAERLNLLSVLGKAG